MREGGREEEGYVRDSFRHCTFLADKRLPSATSHFDWFGVKSDLSE
jgi:hypothetical protein